MRQIVYISTVNRAIAASVEPGAILAVSRHNNARDRITGLLFFNGKRFLQALEGERATVDATLRRIQSDQRHYGLVILSDHDVPVREFGEWAMAYYPPGMDNPTALDRIVSLTANAAPEIRATFEGLARIADAA